MRKAIGSVKLDSISLSDVIESISISASLFLVVCFLYILISKSISPPKTVSVVGTLTDSVMRSSSDLRVEVEKSKVVDEGMVLVTSVVNSVDSSGVDDEVVEESRVVEEGMVLVSSVVNAVDSSGVDDEP